MPFPTLKVVNMSAGLYVSLFVWLITVLFLV